MTKDFIQSVMAEANARKRRMDNIILGRRPIEVVHLSQLEKRVPVRISRAARLSSGEMVAELSKRKVITLHSVEV